MQSDAMKVTCLEATCQGICFLCFQSGWWEREATTGVVGFKNSLLGILFSSEKEQTVET